MSWFAWFRRRKAASGDAPARRVTDEVPEAPPADAQDSLEGVVAFEDEESSGEETRPVAKTEQAAQRAPKRPPEDDGNWFSEGEISALVKTTDPSELSARVAARMPNRCREEQLFRYHLSRSVFLEEFDLPVLPQSATGVMTLARNPRASMQDYVALIEPDASLTREVLATTNSSLFAGRDPIVALPQAVARLGIREIERVALVHTMRSRLFRVAGFEELLASLVEHNLVTSCAAQVTARSIDVKAEDASLAGLFHDVGKLVLLNIMGQVQHKLRWKASEALVSSTFAAFHVRVGALACARWEFPEEIVEAVSSHHDSEAASASPLSSAVYAANQIVNVLGQTTASNEERSMIDELADDPLVVSALGGRESVEAALEEIRRTYHERRQSLAPA